MRTMKAVKKMARAIAMDLKALDRKTDLMRPLLYRTIIDEDHLDRLEAEMDESDSSLGIVSLIGISLCGIGFFQAISLIIILLG